MTNKIQPIITAPFPELTAMSNASGDNLKFEIIIQDQPTIQEYCEKLLDKLFQLRPSEIRKFIDYQCNKVKDSKTWLNKCEKLIASNENLFFKPDAMSRFTKLFNVISEKRRDLENATVKTAKDKALKQYINAETDERYFSFYETKAKVETMDRFEDKILFLTAEIFEYKEADLLLKNTKLHDYDEQCKKMIERIQTMRQMTAELEKSNQGNVQKIRLNGPTNILANAFKQMMTTIKPNGEPYLDYKTKEIASFICNSFADEEGQQLSIETVKTYLSPTRLDKDPNNDMTVKF